jgi:hypothetical protein
LEICNRRAPLQLTKLVKSTRNDAPLGNLSALAARFANRSRYVTIAAVFFKLVRMNAVLVSRCELFAPRDREERSAMWKFRDISEISNRRAPLEVRMFIKSTQKTRRSEI